MSGPMQNKVMKPCDQCGNDFLPWRPQQRFCTTICTNAWHNARKAAAYKAAKRKEEEDEYERIKAKRAAEKDPKNSCAEGGRSGLRDNREVRNADREPDQPEVDLVKLLGIKMTK